MLFQITFAVNAVNNSLWTSLKMDLTLLNINRYMLTVTDFLKVNSVNCLALC